MKRWMLGVLLLPLAAHAGDDYAQQWPLQLSRPDAGAYRVALDAAVYRAAYWRDLRDVRVLDASGKPVASLLQTRPDGAAGQAQHTALRWFTLPVTAASQGSDLSVLVQRSTDGAVVSVRSGAVADNDVAAASAWLVDLGKDSARMHALLLDWEDAAQALDAGYRLEGSDDLRNWRTLDPQVRLVQLRNQGQELRSNRIALDTPPRYLRLLPLQASPAIALRAVQGEWHAAADSNNWQWQPAPVAAGTPAKGGFDYHSDGHFPVQRVDVVMPANTSVRWSVLSRDADTGTSAQPSMAWAQRAYGWSTWQLQDGASTQTSPPLDLNATISDREWRLQLESGDLPASAPTLKLGYQPASIVFLAQGTPPYVLVAGSAAAQDTQDAVAPMLAALRARFGAQWVPAVATLGPVSPRAGSAAYTPPAKPRDWKTLTLWAVLVLGALLVGGIAFSLLRGKPQPAGK